MPYVWTVYSDAFRGARGSTDDDFQTTCAGCGTLLTLDQAEVDMTDPLEVIYSCPNGCGPVMVVGVAPPIRWEERGHVIGKWIIRNPFDVTFHPRGAGSGILIPASPAALD